MSHDAPIPPGTSAYAHYACRCGVCRKANTEYQRKYRQTKAGREKHKRLQRVAWRALVRLRAAHYDEYRRYYDEEMLLEELDA